MKKIINTILFILIICIAFFQISVGNKMLRWDIIDISLPWRYFIDQCIANGILPMWNPFINNGFPQQADPQTWYPISAFFSLFGTYEIKMLHFEFLFHIVIAGIGFNRLSEALGNLDLRFRWALSVAYACSGFMVGNAQHLGWIVSAAWIPWIFYFLKKHFSFPSVKNLIGLILSLFFLLTGGYPGLFIIVAYLIFGTSVFQLIAKKEDRKRNIKSGLLFIGLFTLLSSVVLQSSFEIQDHIYRESLSIEEVTYGSISFKSLISTVFPFVVTNNTDLIGSGLCVSNSYFGTLLIPFLIIGFWKRDFKSLIYFILGIVAILIALGEELPIRQWLYHIPMFDKFRFPAIFRLFFILGALISIGKVYSSLDLNKDKKKVLIVFGGFFLIFLMLSVLCFDIESIKEIINSSLADFISKSEITSRLGIQSIILVVVSIVTVGFIYKSANWKNYFPVIVVFEVILFTQLNAASTVYKNKDADKLSQLIISKGDQYPFPDNDKAYFLTRDHDGEKFDGTWRNVNCYRKIPSFYGYSPYYFTKTEKLEQDSLRENIHASGLVGFTKMLSEDSLTINYEPFSINWTRFNPNEIIFEIDVSQAGYAVVHQNNYPGWVLNVNDDYQKIQTLNYNEIGFQVEKGVNKVELMFDGTNTKTFFWISLMTFLILSFVLFLPKKYLLNII